MTLYSDHFNGSNEMIVYANTYGLGQFKPLNKPEPEPEAGYIIAAAAYWKTMEEHDDAGRACGVLWQSLHEHGIDCADKDELSRALYLESPYYDE